MFEQQLLFLKILCQAIRKESDFELNTEMKDEDWAFLSKMSSDQHVFPLIYDVASRTEEFGSVSEPMRMFWRKNATGLVMSQTRKTKEFLSLYEQMTCVGIEALVVKGIVCRTLYANPDFRISGDEDILIKKEQFAECDSFLLENGFLRDEINVDQPEYETSYFNHKTGLRIEVHVALMPEKVSAFSRLNQEFQNVFEKKENIVVDDVTIYTMDWTTHFFYLLCHSYKHFIFSGFGIRQLCDMMLMAEQYGKVIDWEYVINATKKYGMYVFFGNLMYIAESYLGFDRNKSECPNFGDITDDCENLLMDMLDAGVYGKSTVGREHSTNITLSAMENGSEKENISLISSLFPPKEYMQQHYPYVKKHGWLLPVAWFQRMINYKKKIDTRKKTGEKELNSIETGKKRVQLLRQYGIINEEKVNK